MDIISTKAVEVSIQAVSPALILSAPIRMGAVGALSPHAADATEANTTRKANIGSFFIYPLYFRSRWNRARLCGYARLVRDQIQIFFHPQPCRFSPTS